MYVFGPAYRNPFTITPSQPDGADISRNAIEFKHVDAWKYGHNVVEIIIKKSSDVEPAAGGGDGGDGALRDLPLRASASTGSRARPSSRSARCGTSTSRPAMNLETKNSDYAPQERTLYFGPNFQFRVGRGFLNVGLQLRKEWNHNGHLGTNESYDLGFNVEPVWHLPFRLGGVQLAFDGFADYNTPKGKDAAGRDTRAEFIARPLLKLDVGALVGRQAARPRAGRRLRVLAQHVRQGRGPGPGRERSSRPCSRWPCTCRWAAPATEPEGRGIRATQRVGGASRRSTSNQPRTTPRSTLMPPACPPTITKCVPPGWRSWSTWLARPVAAPVGVRKGASPAGANAAACLEHHPYATSTSATR